MGFKPYDIIKKIENVFNNVKNNFVLLELSKNSREFFIDTMIFLLRQEAVNSE